MYSNKIARSVCTMDLRLWSWELFSSPSSWGSLNTHQYSWKIAYLYNIFQMYFVIVPVTILRVFACLGSWICTWKSLKEVKMICRAIMCVSKTIIKLLEKRQWKILVIQCVKTYITPHRLINPPPLPSEKSSLIKGGGYLIPQNFFGGFVRGLRPRTPFHNVSNSMCILL